VSHRVSVSKYKDRQVIFERVRNGGINSSKRRSTTESSASEGGEEEEGEGGEGREWEGEERKLNVVCVHAVYELLPFKYTFLR
jgi:hypothetical protein